MLGVLCTSMLSFVFNYDDLKKADMLLLYFCCHIDNLYGKEAITPNTHLHAHLQERIHNYGPSYSFWLFSFECYNGKSQDGN